MSETQHIFIVGSKGIPGNYGGYETFVDRYCFEIRSNRYRFRLFAIEFDPSYPAIMTVDRGVCNDLAKIYDRYKFEEAERCNITIQDDEDLDRVFNQLLKSEKLIYICNRLMNETDEMA